MTTEQMICAKRLTLDAELDRQMGEVIAVAAMYYFDRFGVIIDATEVTAEMRRFAPRSEEQAVEWIFAEFEHQRCLSDLQDVEAGIAHG